MTSIGDDDLLTATHPVEVPTQVVAQFSDADLHGRLSYVATRQTAV
jgi:hypothetical protein